MVVLVVSLTGKHLCLVVFFVVDDLNIIYFQKTSHENTFLSLRKGHNQHRSQPEEQGWDTEQAEYKKADYD